jgi:MFS transporter, DHA1 family, multidrug resistance protein
MASRIAPGFLVLVTSLVAMGVASMALYVPSLPAIRAEFGVLPSDTQITLTLFFLGFSFGQLLFGPLSDRFGRRPVLLIGLSLYMVISLSCAFATSIEMLQVGRFFQGFVACVGPVVGRAVVRDAFSGKAAAAAFSVLGTALAVVPAIAPILGGQIQTHIGWRASFYLLAALSLILLIVCAFRLTESLIHKNPDAIKPVRLIKIYAHLLTSPYFMGNVLVSGLAFAGFFAYFTEAPFLFIGELGLREDAFGAMMLFTVTGYASGSFLSGKLVPRLGSRRVVFIGCGFLLVGSGLLLLLSGTLSLVNVIAPMSLYTIGFGMVIPGSMAEALRPFPRVAGSASAVLGFFQFFCAAMTSLIVQPLYDGTAVLLSVVILSVAVLALVQYLILANTIPPDGEA